MLDFDSKDIQFHGEIDNDIFYINLSLTNYCNYQCSYCCAEIPPVNKTSIFESQETIINTLNRLFNFNYKKYFIILTGGEPTIYPNFLDIVKYINSIEKTIYLNIISNGSRSCNYYEELFKSVSNIKHFTLRISIHLEYANIEHIKDIIILANKYKKNILINFMLHPLLKNERSLFYEELFALRKNYIFNISFDELQDGKYYNKVDSRYTEEDFIWIDSIRNKFEKEYKNNSSIFISKPHYIINNKKNKKTISKIEFNKAMRQNKRNFKDMYCVFGIKNISIWGGGDSAGGECVLFKRINIYEPFFDWTKSIGYVKCTLEQCRCTFNDTLPKFRKEEEAKSFIENYMKDMYSKFLSDIYMQLNNYRKVIESDIANLNDSCEKNSHNIIKIINSLAWFIPIRKWRDNFRNKFFDKFIGGGGK